MLTTRSKYDARFYRNCGLLDEKKLWFLIIDDVISRNYNQIQSNI